MGLIRPVPVHRFVFQPLEKHREAYPGRAGKVALHSFRGLRHMFASLMLLAGVHAKIVSEMLGHSSAAFTLDTYSHIVPGLQESAVKHLDFLW